MKKWQDVPTVFTEVRSGAEVVAVEHGRTHELCVDDVLWVSGVDSVEVGTQKQTWD